MSYIEERIARLEAHAGLPPYTPNTIPWTPPAGPQPLPTGGRTGAIGPTTGVGRPGEPPAAPAADHTFNWGNVGEVARIKFNPLQVRSLATPVPFEYRSWLAFKLVQRADEFASISLLNFWISTSPGGTPITGTFYEGPWVSGTLGGEEFKCWPQAGVTYYFNVVVKGPYAATFGVQQDHS